jgi:NAD(P)-dependent dehydrogenase (short-subunit alcohol dehydrogenase family)
MASGPESGFELPAESRGEAPGRGRLAGRRVLVVGAGQTDYGIEDQPIGNGRAIAILLAREGAKVVAADYDQAAADGTVELIGGAGDSAITAVADVRDPDAVQSMVRRAHEWLGGLDGVAYNVGIPGPQGSVAEITTEAWDDTLNANLRGAMLTARAALPVMDRGSAFVFISSVAALTPRGRTVAYESSKAGMAALMRHVALEGQERQIRANVVLPARIDTGLARSHNPRAQSIYAAGPMARAGTAWEVAYAALFLLSDEAAYITAQELAVDGGTSGL